MVTPAGVTPIPVHLHGPGSMEAVEISITETTSVRKLLTGFDGHQIWIEDTEVALGVEVTLVAAGIARGHHLHRGPCHAVDVTVLAEGHEVSRPFSPATRVAKVLDWAASHLGLGMPDDLRAVDAHGRTVPPAVHVGSLVVGGSCAVPLTLRRESHDVKIFVNARPHSVPSGEISFEAVVKLAFPIPPPGMDIEYDVSYRQGPPDHPSGSLLEHHTIQVREGMAFDVSATDKS